VAVLPEPGAYGLPESAVIAVPAAGLDVYRLVRSDRPGLSDFAPVAAERAALRGVPELLRVGLSCFLEPWQAEAVRVRPSSRVARVRLQARGRAHVARTGRTPGHVTVWAPLEELVASADVVD
jgi:hypothetical protein